MLVLTRKKSETIHIGEGIVIKVIQTGSGAIKLGIDAPADVRVLRGEVAEAAANLEANGPAKPSMPSKRPIVRKADPVHQGAV